MNRVLTAAGALLVALLLHAGLAPYIQIAGVTPDFLFIVVVTLGLVQGPRVGMGAGFAGGFLFDLVGTAPIGPGALVFCLAAYLAGSLKENTFAEGWSVPLVVLFLAGLAAGTAYSSALAFLGEASMSLRAFFTVVVPSALYNVGVAVFIYPWLARFLREERSVTMFRRLS